MIDDDFSNNLLPYDGLSDYVDKILAWYVSLPDTPLRYSRHDRKLALELCRRRISPSVIESAFLLATARRHLRDPTLPALPPVRSLYYFLPLIDEILASPLPEGYANHLRQKLRHLNILPAPKLPITP
jgi:hypothetical protein